MTYPEKIKLVKKAITDLHNTNGYIKGFGPKQCRVMDGNHNPLYNMDKEILTQLIQDNKVKQDGLIFKLNLEN